MGLQLGQAELLAVGHNHRAVVSKTMTAKKSLFGAQSPNKSKGAAEARCLASQPAPWCRSADSTTWIKSKIRPRSR